MTTMNTLEDIVQHFGQHATKNELAQMDAQKSFNDAVLVLRSYAKKRLDMTSPQFSRAEKTSHHVYNGPLKTKNDLWLLMLYRKDIGSKGPKTPTPPGPCKLAMAAPSEDMYCAETGGSQPAITPAFRKRKLRGFGKVRSVPRGSGRGFDCRYNGKTTAYIKNRGTGKIYRAGVKDGKVIITRWFLVGAAFFRSVKHVSIPFFSIEWDMRGHKNATNRFFSHIFRYGKTNIIDWAMDLMRSRDIKVSSNSECAGYVPSTLVDSDEKGMVLSEPIRKSYFKKKKFLFNTKTKQVFWDPSDGGAYLMKVSLREGRNNTFRRVRESKVKDYRYLKECQVYDLEKNFV